MIPTLLLSSPALACGGFFCNSTEPVLQAAERIVFAVDEVEGVVETHVQVEYEGPADEFAWIVPVQGEPEIFLTTEVLFTTVGQQLAPVHQMSWEEEGRCKWDGSGGFRSSETQLAADSSGGGNDEFVGGVPAPPPEVQVIATATVGPYETVTLQATDLGALMGWLEDNEYAVPSDAADAIAPYIGPDGYFVALKLVKGNDSGDLAPLGMRYTGDTPAVPIQLTSVAAADDLRLEITVFADHRAVPESYLHVRINDTAIDWFDWGSNYADVITRAADEAGGHGFATDYAGSTEILFTGFAVDADLDELAASVTPTDWIETLQSQGFSGTPDMLALFERWFPVSQGIDPISAYNCPSCNPGWYAGDGFDAAAVTEDLETRVLEPRRAVDDLIAQHAYVTRLTSSLSASEMTIDPTFVLNEAMGDVEAIRTAQLVHECRGGKQLSQANRRLELPSGLVIQLPPMAWFEENGLTESEYLAELGTISAVHIERTGEGEPEVVADLSGSVLDQVEAFNAVQPASGCGCRSSAAPFTTFFMVILGMIGTRVRRG